MRMGHHHTLNYGKVVGAPTNDTSAHLHPHHDPRFAFYTIVASLAYALLYTYMPRSLTRRISPWAQILCISVMAFVLVGVENWKINERLVNRLGRVAYSLIPLSLFLAQRNGGVPYLARIDAHKWTSRLIILLSCAHGSGYIVIWAKNGKLLHAFKILNLVGIVVGISLLVLLVTSVRQIRRRNYSLFYLVHNIIALAFVILICVHARPNVYLSFAVSFTYLAFLAFLRFAYAHSVEDMFVKTKEGLTIQLISMSLPESFPPAQSILPGSHIRLGYEPTEIRGWLGPTHPYTLIPINERAILIAKRTRFELGMEDQLVLTGPFDSMVPPAFFKDERGSRNVKIVCGGLGISFGIALFIHLFYTEDNATLIWCVRNEADTFILDHLPKEVKQGVEVFVTNTVGLADTGRDTFRQGDEANGLLRDIDEIEMLETNPLPTKSDEDVLDTASADTKALDVKIHRRRPDFDTDCAFAGDASHKWVFSCGPPQLNKSVMAWAKAQLANHYAESFEL